MNIKKDTLKFYFIVIYVLSGTYIVWFTNGKSLIGVDDANIYMVYMQNFANGHGFVFNIGGEKVEGFTSLLWTLIGSVAFYITQKPEIILLAINIIIISFTLWKLVCFIDRYLDDTRFLTPSSLFLLGGLILIPGYFEWTVLSLLETGLWSSLLILISLNLLDDQENKNILHNLKFYTLIILLVLCRPESMLWVLWFIVAKFFKVYIDTKSIKKSILQTISAIVVFSVTVVSLILWREAYFGFPLPNTFYAKITSNWIENAIEGLKYIIYCFSNNPLSILSLLLAIGLLYPLSKIKELKTIFYIMFLNGIVFLTFIIPFYTGGDHFNLSRFMQPTLPLILTALIFNLLFLKIRFKYYLSIISLIVFSFGNKNPIYFNIYQEKSPVKNEWDIAKFGRERSEKLNLFFDKHIKYPSQGVIPAGGTAFSYLGFTNDLLGLSNVEMAHAQKNKFKVKKNHSSFNKEVFYKQKPDIVWFGLSGQGRFLENNHRQVSKITISPDLGKMLQNIHLDSKFVDIYSAVIIKNKYLDYSLIIFASNNFLNGLDENIYTYKKIGFE